MPTLINAFVNFWPKCNQDRTNKVGSLSPGFEKASSDSILLPNPQDNSPHFALNVETLVKIDHNKSY